MKAIATTSKAASSHQVSAAGPVTPRPLWSGPVAATRDRRTVAPVRLTPRQLEVLALLCEGLPNKLICRRLNIATGTVKIHISCILRELGVTSRLQAALSARRRGLLGELAASAPEQDVNPAAAGHLATVASPDYGTSRRLGAAA